MQSSNYFLEVGFVDDSDVVHDLYEEVLYGEVVDDFEMIDWSER